MISRNVEIALEKSCLSLIFCERLHDKETMMFTGTYMVGFAVGEAFKPEALHKNSSIPFPDDIGTIDLKFSADFCEAHMICRTCLHFLKVIRTSQDNVCTCGKKNFFQTAAEKTKSREDHYARARKRSHAAAGASFFD